MSANWGSASPNIHRESDRKAKWMIRSWFVVTCMGLIFILCGGRI